MRYIKSWETADTGGNCKADILTVSVRLIIGASAYAHIKADNGAQFDVLLAPGNSASYRLLEKAKEYRDDAARLIGRAEMMEAAALKI